jgi:hypothetical protein
MSKSSEPEPKRRPVLSALSFVIAIVALIAFIVLNRMMAPPFPRFSVSPTAGLTNYTATNAASSNSPAVK